MHYLTVQDIIWVNTLAMKSPRRFDFAKLEEASYYQYAFGGSSDLAAQSARFLSGFLQKAPFEAGNRLTGFVAFAAFLMANGKRLKSAEASRVMSDPTAQGVAGAVEDLELGGHDADIKAIIAKAFVEYSETIAGLSG